MVAEMLQTTLPWISALPIIIKFLHEHDDETQDSFYTSLWLLKINLYF